MRKLCEGSRKEMEKYLGEEWWGSRRRRRRIGREEKAEEVEGKREF